MTYEDAIAIQTAQEILKHETVCKNLEGVRIDDYTLACIQFVISKGIKQAMQAQREACAEAYLDEAESLKGQPKPLQFLLKKANIAKAILKAEVKV